MISFGLGVATKGLAEQGDGGERAREAIERIMSIREKFWAAVFVQLRHIGQEKGGFPRRMTHPSQIV